MQNRWEVEAPVQVNAYIGYCPICRSVDELIFLLKDSKGDYEHCMECNSDFEVQRQNKCQQ